MSSVSSSVGSGARVAGGNRPGGKLSPRQLLAAQAKTESEWCDAMNGKLPRLLPHALPAGKYRCVSLEVNGFTVQYLGDVVLCNWSKGVDLVPDNGGGVVCVDKLTPARYELFEDVLTIHIIGAR